MNTTASTSYILSIAVGVIAAVTGVSASFTAAAAYTTQQNQSVQQTKSHTSLAQQEKSSITHTTKEVDTLISTSTPVVAQPTVLTRYNPLYPQSVGVGNYARSSYRTPKEMHENARKRARKAPGKTPALTATDKKEILWLARIIYSETKRPHEQRLVAWVVRNRVETGYTGQTYRAVATHSSQFSGLNPSNPRYEHNMSRYWASQGENWRTALKIAREVYFAPESERPFSVTTRHFYSPKALYGKPDWARGRQAVRIIKSSTNAEPRFAFYARVR